ncbi:Endonuclease/exonuclease/phosphatase [Corchorus olitorius]|uniref:Endonuclease/exonuclease/phosphatase n=1 Tax=Corchorus olitorius TaxID=93759 RepID=A0A1R3JXT8_9ROSI|nr:Endonuclease/exonuclease/phosphatase [Corchorus olitorius]
METICKTVSIENGERLPKQSAITKSAIQQPDAAKKIAKAAGEVIKVDWEDTPTRNIRFMRVRVVVNPWKPLMPGCLITRDDGVDMWVPFRYERVCKLCTTCGIIGHKRGFCPYQYGQVEEMINQQIREATERVDMPCVTIPNINQFTAEMKAYNRRRSRRNTRFYYLGDGNDGAGTSQQGAAIGAMRGFTTVPTTPTHSPPTDLQHQTRSENLEVPNINTVTTQPLNPLEFLTQNQTLNHRENPNLLAQDTPLTQTLTQPLHPETPIINIVATQIQNTSENMIINQTLNLGGEPNLPRQNSPPTLNIVDPLYLDPSNQVQTLTRLEPSPDLFIPDSSIPSSPLEMELEPIVDLEALEQNAETTDPLGDADTREIYREIEEIMASVIADRYNYEMLYDQVLTEGEQALEGLRSRVENNPHIQPRDNTPRWVGFQNGVFTLTNARVVEEQSAQLVGNTRESREVRREEQALQGDLNFSLELETHLWQDNSDGEEKTYTFEMLSGAVDGINNLNEEASQGGRLTLSNYQGDTGAGTNQVQLNSDEAATIGVGESESQAACITNEEDFSALYLNDEPVENPTQVETGEARESPKRKRDELEEDSQGSEDGRQVRRRLQLLNVNDPEESRIQTERVRNLTRGARELKECLDACCLSEIPAKGQFFTWTNNREEDQVVWERLDRAFANPTWFRQNDKARLLNLPVEHSDHGPIILQTEELTPFKRRPYRKRLEQEIASKQASLDTIQSCAEERRLRFQLEEVAEQEQIFWMPKSRTDWIIRGDRNTKFYHTVTAKRRVRNRISRVKGEDGYWKEDQKEIEDTFYKAFEEIFTKEDEASESDIREALQNLNITTLNNNHKEILNKPFVAEEVKLVAFQIGP